MPLITDDIHQIAERVNIWILSTINRDGTPHSIPVSFKKVLGDNEMLLMDNYMNTTLANIQERPDKVSISFWDKGVFHLYGTARIETTGQLYEDGVRLVKSRRKEASAKSAIVVKVTATSYWERPQ